MDSPSPVGVKDLRKERVDVSTCTNQEKYNHQQALEVEDG